MASRNKILAKVLPKGTDYLLFPHYLIWIAAAYVFGVWWYLVPFTGDEKIYLNIATENFLAGNWLQPLLFGEPNYFKPPLQLWATLIGWSVFGYSALGGLLPSSLATLGTAWGIGLLSRRLGGRGEVTAPLWFAGLAGTLTYGCVAQMEIWLALLFTWAWWAAIVFEQEGDTRYLYLAYIFAGALALVKSPIHSACWVFGHWLYLAWNKNARKVLGTPHLWGALVLGIGVGLSWYLAAWRADPQRFWEQYIVRETQRQVGGNGSTALWLYGNTLVQTLPLTLLMLASWFGLGTQGLRQLAPLALGWVGGMFVVFTYTAYRTETYLYPCAPLFALLADAGLRRGSLQPWLTRIHALMFCAALIFGAWVFVTGGLLPLPFGSALALVAIAHAAYAWRGRVRVALLWVLPWVLLIRLGSAWIGADDLRDLRQKFAARSERRIVFLNETQDMFFETGILGMALGRPAVSTARVADAAARVQDGDVLVLADWQQPRIAEIRAAMGGRGQVTQWRRWKRGFTKPKLADFFSIADRSNPEWQSRNRRIFWLLTRE